MNTTNTGPILDSNTSSESYINSTIIPIIISVSVVFTLIIVGIAIRIVKPKTPFTSADGKKGRSTAKYPAETLPLYNPINNNYSIVVHS